MTKDQQDVLWLIGPVEIVFIGFIVASSAAGAIIFSGLAVVVALIGLLAFWMYR